MLQLLCNDDNEWFFSDDLADESIKEFNDAMDEFEFGEGEVAESKLKSIITDNPYHIDAYHHLSMLWEEVGIDFEAYLCAREAARIGLSVIPENFNWNTARVNWANLCNRPFLRAYHNLGLWLERRKETTQAITVFNNLISICPNDNIGARHELPKLWLETGDYLSLVRLCKKYHEECSPEILYTHSLSLFLLKEDEKALTALDLAIKEFPLFAQELKKKCHKKPTSSIDGYVSFAGGDHAYEYWKIYGKYWDELEHILINL